LLPGAWHHARVAANVSVILPTRGDSVHLRHAVASALACPETSEVLVLCSEGDLGPARVVDPRVHTVPRDGGGVSSARNAGIEAARGAYLAFLDDDDVWTPDHLTHALEMFRRYPTAVLTGCSAWLFVDDSEDGSTAPPAHTTGLALHRPGAIEEELTFGRLLMENPVTTPTVVLVADRLRFDDRFDPSLSHMEDYDLWLRLARDRKLVFDPRPSVLVRKRRGSASRDRRRMAEASLEVLARHVSDEAEVGVVHRAELRSRRGRLWHELAYACFVEGDVQAGRQAARRAIAENPGRLKNYSHLVASYLPSSVRDSLFAGGRIGHHAETARSSSTSRRDTTSAE
jgi:glycosyltransferase involved in cell wall biosynthesis